MKLLVHDMRFRGKNLIDTFYLLCLQSSQSLTPGGESSCKSLLLVRPADKENRNRADNVVDDDPRLPEDVDQRDMFLIYYQKREY